MLGAIIGDIAGSYLEVLEVNSLKEKGIRSYEERIKILNNDTPLFNENYAALIKGVKVETALASYSFPTETMSISSYIGDYRDDRPSSEPSLQSV